MRPDRVMVVDDDPMNQQILGIFTSKDLTQRVIAPGLDPAQELVSQAMTSHPDCASLDTTILDIGPLAAPLAGV